jgi:Tol biopolymer transport system component
VHIISLSVTSAKDSSMAQQATQFQTSISALAWRPDGKQLALTSYNSCDIEVFDVPSSAGEEWTKTATLKGVKRRRSVSYSTLALPHAIHACTHPWHCARHM